MVVNNLSMKDVLVTPVMSELHRDLIFTYKSKSLCAFSTCMKLCSLHTLNSIQFQWSGSSALSEGVLYCHKTYFDDSLGLKFQNTCYVS